MKTICLTIAFSLITLMAQAETFTGVITDTMCGRSHEMMKNQPPSQCIKICTKGQFTYALYDGTNLYKLTDPKKPAQFAAQKVKVTGTLNPKDQTIKVTSIEPIEE